MPFDPPLTAPHPAALVGFVGPTAAALARAFAAAGVRALVVSPDPEPDEAADESPHPARATLPDPFETTADLTRLRDATALIVAAGATVTRAGSADTAPVAAAAAAVGSVLRPGQLVVCAGAAPPGTVRSVAIPALAPSGLVPGRDFLLAYTPDPDGDAGPRIVGGFDPASTDAAAALFGRLARPVVRVSSLEAAEVCGAVGPMVRAIQTAAANELTAACARLGVDAWEAIKASGAGPLAPGPSGGEAAALLVWGARRRGASFPLLERATQINAGRTGYILARVADALNDAGKAVRGSAVAVLGLGPETDTTAPGNSPGADLMALLLRMGARATYNDPHLPALPRRPGGPPGDRRYSQPLTAEYLTAQDCVLVAADRPEYDYAFIVRHSGLVIDARNATRAVTAGREKIVRA